MASTPITREMFAKIEEMGGNDKILERVASGETLTAIAKELGVSRGFFSWKINKVPGMKEALEKARKARAEAWADEALEIADNVPENPNAIGKAKLRVEQRRWLASVNDPETYGQKKSEVNISIGALHLDALRKVQADLAREEAEARANTIEGEVLRDGE